MISALGLTAVYVVLFSVALLRRSRRNSAGAWLLVYCAYSALLMTLHGIILGGQNTLSSPFSDQFLLTVGFALSIGLIGLITITYLEMGRKAVQWGVSLLLAWVAAVVVTGIMNLAPVIGAQPWFTDLVGGVMPLSVELSVAGWIALTVTLFILIWRTFLTQHLPLHANRILFWAVVLPFLVFGDILSARFLPTPWHYVGYVIRLIGALGAVYSITVHRVMDLREMVRWLVSRLILLLVTAGLVVGGIMATFTLRLPELEMTRDSERWVIAITSAVVIAVLLPPITQFLQWMLRHMMHRISAEPAEAVRLYSQRISGVIDLKELAEAAFRTINELLATSRGFLILATQEGARVTFEEVRPDGEDPNYLGQIGLDSLLYKRLVGNGQPLLQYDIDYDKRYITVTEEERRFFGNLSMDIYAPIIGEGKLAGLLAVGPKTNDDPFRTNEIELLEALASQTVVALENARLVADLRGLNETMTILNADLKASNERLERLDSVKSDFITIASHELRTPLTQVQGYAELLREMAERNILDPAEATEVTQNLSEATKRMTEVITAMMEVSQIDVESMDLTFIEMSMESVLKLAIEPYSDAIRERKQMLIGKGLSTLPPIYGDYKRLVQAFQNLVTNAIKFTPDGGRIDISGQVYEKDSEGNPVSIRVMVKDTGVGVAPENVDLVFEKFFRASPVSLHSTGKTKFKGAGPGLGLSIARGIIEGHGGQIWVESKGYSETTYPGSIFHVVLPVHPPTLDVHQQLKDLQPIFAEEAETEADEEDPTEDTILL